MPRGRTLATGSSGVVLLFTGRPTATSSSRPRCILGGANAVLTGSRPADGTAYAVGPHAATTAKRHPEMHILVPSDRQVRSVGFVHVERTQRLPNCIVRSGVPLVPLVRACTDSARRISSAAEVTELLSEPVQRGCARSGRSGQNSSRITAGHRRAPRGACRRRRRSAFGSGASGQAVVAEDGTARSLVERRRSGTARVGSSGSPTAGWTKSRWSGRSSRASGTSIRPLTSTRCDEQPSSRQQEPSTSPRSRRWC